MKLLALSTAEQGSSLAIIDGDRLVCDEYWDAKQTHSKRLLTMVEQMIEKRSGLALADIDAFIAAKGPGSFTGLRIGISVIKGLAYATQKPAMGASSLDGIAFRFLHANMPVCVMMDAKRNEVYTALYSFENGNILFKPTKCKLEQFRPTKHEAISYFIAGEDRACDEDGGFAISGWTKVRFENTGFILEDNRAIAMGNYYFTDADGNEAKVEYTFGYKMSNGALKIDLHHSSFPYNP